MKEPKTLFETWLRKAVNQSLYGGLVNIYDIEDLYTNVKEAAYQQGYEQGYAQGYNDRQVEIEAGFLNLQTGEDE